MAHVKKFNRGAIGHMARHYARAKNEDGTYVKFGNQEIDTEKSHLNYNLAPYRSESQIDFVAKRCSEVRCLNRKDVNVMASWVVTLPQEMNDFPEEEGLFFRETYNFLKDRYGEENVVSAYVHKDENQPHLHFAFVPVVKDKKKGDFKVSAKECLSRVELQKFHGELDQHMQKVFGRDIGILNEATKEGNKEIHELKRSTRLQELQKLDEEVKVLEEDKKGLQNELESLKKETGDRWNFASKVSSIEKNAKKTLMGKIQLSQEDFSFLTEAAQDSLSMEISLEQMTQREESLAYEVEGLRRQVPTMEERMEMAQAKKSHQAFMKLPHHAQEVIESDLFEPQKPEMTMEDLHRYIDRVSKKYLNEIAYYKIKARTEKSREK